ncbi:MAG TPA: shikimate kinase [Clostridiaceae bacterium]|nr:shikimate kinase [Clostridiaceae bacterium]
MKKSNIVLIGMPGAGKSTIGPLLAGNLKMEYIDTDTIIKDRENKNLADIVNEYGLEKFLEIQEEVVLGLDVENHVIATGGSIVYNGRAMEHLKANGIIVYLKLELEEVKQRVDRSRRFARNLKQDFDDIYFERAPLYEKYADMTVNCSGKEINAIINEILNGTNFKMSHKIH